MGFRRGVRRVEEIVQYFGYYESKGVGKKVFDLVYPSTTSMCPPPVKYKSSRREVKKSRKDAESNVHRDPSQWEYAKASQGSQATKRSCTQPSGSQSSTIPIGR